MSLNLRRKVTWWNLLILFRSSSQVKVGAVLHLISSSNCKISKIEMISVRTKNKIVIIVLADSAIKAGTVAKREARGKYQKIINNLLSKWKSKITLKKLLRIILISKKKLFLLQRSELVIKILLLISLFQQISTKILKKKMLRFRQALLG